MNCLHEKTKVINVVVIAGVINRQCEVCEKCGMIIESQDYDAQKPWPIEG